MTDELEAIRARAKERRMLVRIEPHRQWERRDAEDDLDRAITIARMCELELARVMQVKDDAWCEMEKLLTQQNEARKTVRELEPVLARATGVLSSHLFTLGYFGRQVHQETRRAWDEVHDVVEKWKKEDA